MKTKRQINTVAKRKTLQISKAILEKSTNNVKNNNNNKTNEIYLEIEDQEDANNENLENKSDYSDGKSPKKIDDEQLEFSNNGNEITVRENKEIEKEKEESSTESEEEIEIDGKKEVVDETEIITAIEEESSSGSYDKIERQSLDAIELDESNDSDETENIVNRALKE